MLKASDGNLTERICMYNLLKAIFFIVTTLSVAEAQAYLYESVVAGNIVNYVVKTDGTLWAEGVSNLGQFGDGRVSPSPSPFRKVFSDVKAVYSSASSNHVLVLKNDATLWAAGSNGSGQLGDGTVTNSSLFKQVLANVVLAATGNQHSIALKTDGTLWVTGVNYDSQFGPPAGPNSLVWKQAMAGVKSIAAGGNHILALRVDGTVWAIGYGCAIASGLICDGSGPQSRSWRQIATEAKAIAAGANQSFVISNADVLFVTGANEVGQLGNGIVGSGASHTTVTYLQPVLSGISSVVSGIRHSLAIGVDGSLWGTGVNGAGQLGGASVGVYAWQKIELDIKKVGVSSSGTIFLKNDGTIWGGGPNNIGLGNGTGIASGQITHNFVPFPLF